jgi:hypothetical protein
MVDGSWGSGIGVLGFTMKDMKGLKDITANPKY